jgi:hypothetical protein
MSFTDGQDDDVLAAISNLRAYDVSPRRAEQLRSRCHDVLHAPRRPNLSVSVVLGGAWCVTYLMEIIRRAAAVYGF